MCSGGKLALVRELGAADAIDYTTTDPLGLGRIWDAIIDTAGNVGEAVTPELVKVDLSQPKARILNVGPGGR